MANKDSNKRTYYATVYDANGNVVERYTGADKYPYIAFDADGNPHIVTDKGTILYEYAKTVSVTDSGLDNDAGQGHAASNRNERDGDSGTDANSHTGAD
jgi:hypothetical protein